MGHLVEFPVEEIQLVLTRMVLCRLELTLLNMSFPTMVAMVGKTRAPHRILVADTWSARGLASAGIRGTGQPIPAEMQRRKQEALRAASDEPPSSRFPAVKEI